MQTAQTFKMHKRFTPDQARKIWAQVELATSQAKSGRMWSEVNPEFKGTQTISAWSEDNRKVVM